VSIAALAANVTAYTWTAAVPATSYSFRVTAVNAVGESVVSNTATVTTPAPPAAPSSLAATASANGTQVSLTWTDNSINETGFNVYKSTDGTNFTLLATTAANATTYTWTGATVGTTYSFRVAAVNAVAESAPTNTATVTTPAPPAAPSNLVATPAANGTQVNLTWTDNATTETGFNVYVSTNGTTWSLLTTTAANVASYSWMTASPGTAYSLQAKAVHAAGDSAASHPATAPT